MGELSERRIIFSIANLMCRCRLAGLCLALVCLFQLSACSLLPNREVLMALHTADVALLHDPNNVDPLDTGIPSLDELNQHWNVDAMVPVYPDVDVTDELALEHGLVGTFKLVVPPLTDIEELIAAYEADPHVEYAEYNEPVSIPGN
mgnify:FL=1